MIPKLCDTLSKRLRLSSEAASLSELLELWDVLVRDPVLEDLERAATEAGENLDSVVRFVSASQLEPSKGSSVEVVNFDDMNFDDLESWWRRRFEAQRLGRRSPEWRSKVSGQWEEE